MADSWIAQPTSVRFGVDKSELYRGQLEMIFARRILLRVVTFYKDNLNLSNRFIKRGFYFYYERIEKIDKALCWSIDIYDRLPAIVRLMHWWSRLSAALFSWLPRVQVPNPAITQDDFQTL